MDKSYKILEHIADVRVRAFGKTKEELFLNAMKGMNAVLKPQIKDKKSPPTPRLRRASKIRNIKIKSVDLNALLVDFLSEVLYQIQTNKEIYNDVKFEKFSDIELEGELTGNKVELFGEDIKAVTYHKLEIKRNKEGLYGATVLFDI
jgi:SHS2 domain-containing protein